MCWFCFCNPRLATAPYDIHWTNISYVPEFWVAEILICQHTESSNLSLFFVFFLQSQLLIHERAFQ